MGLFGRGYSKPGSGVTKEQAAKRNYFEILGRKFWKLIQLNLLYALVTLPFWGGSILLGIGYGGPMGILEGISECIRNKQPVLLPILPFLPWMLIGPFTAGLTYVVRNYSRQEHAFLVSDFFEHTKKNWKQGLMASVLATAVTYLFLTAFLFYLRYINPTILLAIAFVLTMMLICSSYYVYPIMVTFDMKFRYILKNSWIFAVGKFPQNLFFTIIIFGVHLLLMYYLFPLWCILMPVILVAWSSYTMNYYVWHVLNKYMIKSEEGAAEEAVFSDALKDDSKK